MSETVRKIS